MKFDFAARILIVDNSQAIQVQARNFNISAYVSDEDNFCSKPYIKNLAVKSNSLGLITHLTQNFRAIHLKVNENINFNQHPVSSFAS